MRRYALLLTVALSVLGTAGSALYAHDHRSFAPGNIAWVSQVGVGIMAPACAGSACVSPANSCGMTDTGTEQADGSCSATTPPESLCQNAPHGYHDGNDNGACVVSGWAYDPNTPSQAIEVHVYRDGPAGGGGVGVGAYTASAVRPDIAGVTGGSTNHGYNISLPGSLRDGQSHMIYVYGIDTSGNGNNPLLTYSPKSIQCAPAASPTLSLNVDGNSGTVYVAPSTWHVVNWNAQNVQDNSCYISNYNHVNGVTDYINPSNPPSYSSASPVMLANSGSAQKAYGAREGRRDLTLHCTGNNGQSVQSTVIVMVGAAPAGMPQGAHDTANGGACTTTGWAYDPDTPSQAIDVHIYRDGPAGGGGVGVGAYTANQNRPDIAGATGGTTNHGFNITLPASLKDGVVHELYAYAIDSSGNGNNPLLPGSPKAINCAPEPVACTSAPNVCGMVGTGFSQGGGACNAQTPPNAQCAPVLSTSAAMNAGGTALANGARVRAGTVVTISWSAQYVEPDSCRVTSDTSPISWSGESGSQQATINSETTFTLACRSYAGTMVTSQMTLKILPTFQEL